MTPAGSTIGVFRVLGHLVFRAYPGNVVTRNPYPFICPVYIGHMTLLTYIGLPGRYPSGQIHPFSRATVDNLS